MFLRLDDTVFFMLRLNFFVIVGALLVFVGVFMTIVGIFEGGLVGSVGVFGATIPSVLSIILGFALIKIGTRPKGFARQRAHHQKS
jgi:uncharacterized Tic20 family protein